MWRMFWTGFLASFALESECVGVNVSRETFCWNLWFDRDGARSYLTLKSILS